MQELESTTSYGRKYKILRPENFQLGRPDAPIDTLLDNRDT